LLAEDEEEDAVGGERDGQDDCGEENALEPVRADYVPYRR
jgi:hypothetical protein